ncbi:hypothetical protein BN1013_01143 [Candidatus Rubidus massiliensis]|nr:hypothetical protein BN1013_01143 [Candidatus Rubidus massiliensis]
MNECSISRTFEDVFAGLIQFSQTKKIDDLIGKKTSEVKSTASSFKEKATMVFFGKNHINKSDAKQIKRNLREWGNYLADKLIESNLQKEQIDKIKAILQEILQRGTLQSLQNLTKQDSLLQASYLLETRITQFISSNNIVPQQDLSIKVQIIETNLKSSLQKFSNETNVIYKFQSLRLKEEFELFPRYLQLKQASLLLEFLHKSNHPYFFKLFFQLETKIFYSLLQTFGKEHLKALNIRLKEEVKKNKDCFSEIFAALDVKFRQRINKHAHEIDAFNETINTKFVLFEVHKIIEKLRKLKKKLKTEIDCICKLQQLFQNISLNNLSLLIFDARDKPSELFRCYSNQIKRLTEDPYYWKFAEGCPFQLIYNKIYGCEVDEEEAINDDDEAANAIYILGFYDWKIEDLAEHGLLTGFPTPLLKKLIALDKQEISQANILDKNFLVEHKIKINLHIKKFLPKINLRTVADLKDNRIYNKYMLKVYIEEQLKKQKVQETNNKFMHPLLIID